ncbi:MAG TPA: IPT/TIG domain-containing protein, partial [Candidatus Angelobacter sp.]|nr:IPT/TIG domain-containing protein [Candidatus Angelobacter sp.]
MTTFNITVTANPSHLTIGSTTGSKITVQAANAQDGTPPPNLTPVTLTTTLGEFNSVGSATQSVNLQLVGGRAQAVLFPGTSAGTATVGATSVCGTSQGTSPPCPSPPTVFTPGGASVSIGSPGTFFVNSLSPNTGDPAGGLVVTISGGGFAAPVGVTFGSSSAPVKSVSPNAIQVITPPSATPVPVGTTLQVSVTVTNNIGGTLGGSATLTNAFTYVPGGGGIQQPQIFSVNPGSGTNDGGTQV